MFGTKKKDNEELPSWMQESPADVETPPPDAPLEAPLAQKVQNKSKAAKVTNNEQDDDPTPSWMRTSQPEATGTAQAGTNGRVEVEQTQPREKKHLSQFHHFLRLANMVCVFGTAFTAVWCLLGRMGQPDMAKGTLAVYVFFFSTLLCFFELQLKILIRLIGENFGFLFTAFGRFLFFGCLGMLVLPLGFLGKGFAVICAAFAVVNFIVLLVWPEYTSEQLRIIEEAYIAK